MLEKTEKKIFTFFEITLILKAVGSGLEILGGFFLLIANKDLLLSYIFDFLRKELIENPNSFFANFIFKIATNYSFSSQAFLILYLLIHGFLRIFLVVALFKKKLWAYPIAIIIFLLFTIYEIYSFALNHSIYLGFVIVLDILVLALTVYEYKRLRKTLIQ